MTAALPSILTLSDFLARPDIDESPAWEYYNGEISQKPMGGGKHSLLQKYLVRVIDQASDTHEAFSELRCTLQGRSIVPDIVVLATDQIPLDDANEITSGGLTIAPPWVIEILSPKQSQTKVTGNILHCLNHGSHLAWLIDPETRSLLTYQPDQLPSLWTTTDPDSGTAPLPVLSEVDLTLSAQDIFSWLKGR